jgi:hypothetical protein
VLAPTTFRQGRRRPVALRSRIDMTLAGPRPGRQGPVADRDFRLLTCVLHVLLPTANRRRQGVRQGRCRSRSKRDYWSCADRWRHQLSGIRAPHTSRMTAGVRSTGWAYCVEVRRACVGAQCGRAPLDPPTERQFGTVEVGATIAV